ncbi:uncharacterized protein K489DRAFT_48540 [Dissoconium aciculare CBS 342.82]|uniref:Uncharacterized protein n=1 Tax=Dissoconium aciculare CBS 342.82 TaxID=1314786 RepID=A0A6J3LY17_9PEZI|nr:uncharacterized protein K489DRAFT_48540 [Dissoconium aciculare CBS 342.82]KAF1820184.1 hypothetical protein K489DRAFT_48540 [Dissoconium aciculare CBS 342.82]
MQGEMGKKRKPTYCISCSPGTLSWLMCLGLNGRGTESLESCLSCGMRNGGTESLEMCRSFGLTSAAGLVPGLPAALGSGLGASRSWLSVWKCCCSSWFIGEMALTALPQEMGERWFTGRVEPPSSSCISGTGAGCGTRLSWAWRCAWKAETVCVASSSDLKKAGSSPGGEPTTGGGPNSLPGLKYSPMTWRRCSSTLPNSESAARVVSPTLEGVWW